MFEPIVEREIASAESWLVRAQEYWDKDMLVAAIKCLKLACLHALRAAKIGQLEKAPALGNLTPVRRQQHWHN